MVTFLLISLLVSSSGDAARFRADSQVVLVPVSVTDRSGAPVIGLPPGAFSVTEDNVPQQISSFSEEDTPASIGIVFDASGSMRQALPQAKSMLSAFFRQCNPEDEAFLYTVSSRPDLTSEYSSDFDGMAQRLLFTGAGGATALTDTIYAAIRKSRSGQRGRKALVVISDGMDNRSRFTKAELRELAREADLQIYSISVFDSPHTKKPMELQEQREGIAFLEELSRGTGGIQVVVRNEREIEQAAARIGTAIRNRYLIGYVPEGGNDDKWRRIRVRTNVPNTRATSRSGYFAANR